MFSHVVATAPCNTHQVNSHGYTGTGAKPEQQKGGLFAPKAPFFERPMFVLWTAAQPDPAAAEAKLVAADPAAFKEWKDKYDQSRRSLTRTGTYLPYAKLVTCCWC